MLLTMNTILVKTHVALSICSACMFQLCSVGIGFSSLLDQHNILSILVVLLDK